MLARLRFLLFSLAAWCLLFSAARGLFLLYHVGAARLLSADLVRGVFTHGFPLDVATAAYLVVLPSLAFALTPTEQTAAWARRFARAWTWVTVPFVCVVIFTDLETFGQWNHRLDGMLFTYLKTPSEAWASAESSPWAVLLPSAAVFIALALALFVPLVKRLTASIGAVRVWQLPVALLVALTLVVPARGGFQLAPINQSSAYFSASPFANQAALNVVWNLVATTYRDSYEGDNPFLAESEAADAAGFVRAYRGADTAAAPRLLRLARPNVLLIIWESASARAVKALGGLPGVTPSLDTLRRHGLLFTHFYAAGERTDKGLVGLMSGFPQTPRVSIIKSPTKSASLPFLSADLRAAGYSTAFYYGGELAFANLETYLRNASFDRLLSKYDFPREERTTKWGVHDGVVAERVLSELRQAKTPFFATWLTLSSHEPFNVPGRIRFPGDRKQPRFLSALAYTDSILGQFLSRATRESWWDSTLVVVVADHGQHMWELDADSVPRTPGPFYHVPMLWLGGALAVRGATIPYTASQTDVAPTLLNQLSLDAQRYEWGHDVLALGHRHWAYYAFDEGFGVVGDSGQVVFEAAANRVAWQSGRSSAEDLRLGKALLGLTYRDYLRR